MKYKVEKDYFIKIEIENNNIFIEETGHPGSKARYLAENKIFVKDMNAIIIFEKDTIGNKTKAVVFQGLLKWSGKRIEK